MKLVDRVSLMRMPEGTVYQEWDPCILGRLMIKGETITDTQFPLNVDWYENCLGASLDMNESQFELDSSVCREGCFDPKLRYLVYDKIEVQNIVSRLQAGPSRCPASFTLPFPAEEPDNGPS